MTETWYAQGVVPMIYAALGDSLTYGYNATADKKHFVNRLHRSLSKMQRVSLFTIAKPGFTSKQLLKSVRLAPKCIWDETGVITILVGGNDLLRVSPWLLNGITAKSVPVAERLAENLLEIVHIVKRPYNRILIGTVYNPFPNSLAAEEGTSMLNKSVRLVAYRENLTLVDLHQSFKRKEHLLIDGYKNGQMRDFKIHNNPIHPNDFGHYRIAEAFLIAYRKRNGTRLKQQSQKRIGAKLSSKNERLAPNNASTKST